MIMKKWCKPKILTAYTYADGMLMVGIERKVRGWCAEQGASKRIIKVRIQLQTCPKKKK